MGGGQIGYNWQVNQFVLGVEAYAVGTGLNGSSASASRTIGAPIFEVPVTQTVTVDFGHIDWIASFRGPAGFAINQALFSPAAPRLPESEPPRPRSSTGRNRHSARNILGIQRWFYHALNKRPKVTPVPLG